MPSSLQAGASLVELLIASLLASFLLLSLIEVYSSVNLTWHHVNVQTDLSERERYIMVFASHFFESLASTGIHVKGYDKKPPRYWARQRLASSSLLLVTSKQKQQAWFVANTTRRDGQGRRIRALFTKIKGQRRQELIDGVRIMRYEYLVFQQQQWQWLPAAQVLHWSAVSAIQWHLLLRALTPVRYKAPRVWFLNRWQKNNKGEALQAWTLVVAVPHLKKDVQKNKSSV